MSNILEHVTASPVAKKMMMMATACSALMGMVSCSQTDVIARPDGYTVRTSGVNEVVKLGNMGVNYAGIIADYNTNKRYINRAFNWSGNGGGCVTNGGGSCARPIRTVEPLGSTGHYQWCTKVLSGARRASNGTCVGGARLLRSR